MAGLAILRVTTLLLGRKLQGGTKDFLDLLPAFGLQLRHGEIQELIERKEPIRRSWISYCTSSAPGAASGVSTFCGTSVTDGICGA